MQQVIFNCVRVRTLDVKAAVHAMHQVFHDSATDAIILVDTSNAFNNINRQVSLLNILKICPAITTFLINCYRRNAQLFVRGKAIFSKKAQPKVTPSPWSFSA